VPRLGRLTLRIRPFTWICRPRPASRGKKSRIDELQFGRFHKSGELVAGPGLQLLYEMGLLQHAKIAIDSFVIESLTESRTARSQCDLGQGMEMSAQLIDHATVVVCRHFRPCNG
jgi:hypothetical protein